MIFPLATSRRLATTVDIINSSAASTRPNRPLESMISPLFERYSSRCDAQLRFASSQTQTVSRSSASSPAGQLFYSMNAPNPYVLKIVLAAVEDDLADAWERHCGDLPDVSVHRGSILDLPVDAVVSPANSFGFMDGGIDHLYSDRFGWEVQDRLQKLIRT